MEQRRNETEVTYWHPAFYADIQIELMDDADNLVFENEHQLGINPMEIDVLIIKKETDRPVKKNIGRIFRKYNIVEYKSPDDSLNIDDFYKVYGYVCFYKVDVPFVDSIPVKLCPSRIKSDPGLHFENSISAKGVEGAITSATERKKGGWCYGYIFGFIPVCDYALRCYNSCYLHQTQKVAPSVW